MSKLAERLRGPKAMTLGDFDILCGDAAARIEALEAALRRIDAINDSPARFSKDIDDVCRAVLAEGHDK